jgi:glycosyltransferase involved in cell wall biosynthesis
VASDIPAIRSILQRPGGRLLGTLVPVADSQALARSLAAVLDAPRDDAALSEGRDAFLGEFTTAAVAEQMAALYRSVIRPR